jgi:hypothetical protein
VKPIAFHPEADEEDLRESERFYESRSGHQLVLSFTSDPRAALARIARDPERFRRVPKYPAVQKCRLGRFPFTLYYLNRADDVYVIAVAHNARRPLYWLERLRGEGAGEE